MPVLGTLNCNLLRTLVLQPWAWNVAEQGNSMVFTVEGRCSNTCHPFKPRAVGRNLKQLNQLVINIVRSRMINMPFEISVHFGTGATIASRRQGTRGKEATQKAA